MTVMTYVTYMLCACFERQLTGDLKVRSTYKVSAPTWACCWLECLG